MCVKRLHCSFKSFITFIDLKEIFLVQYKFIFIGTMLITRKVVSIKNLGYSKALIMETNGANVEKINTDV